MKIKKIRTYQLALFMFFVGLMPCLANVDIFSIQEENIRGYACHYNSLPEVGVADINLKSQPQFPEFLERAKEVIDSYDFSTHTGLRLIHRHFDLDSRNIIVQEPTHYEGKPALIASSLSVDEALNKRAVPSGWIFGDSRHIFEFSTDEAVRSDILHIQNTPEFLDKMENLIKEFKLENLISLSLLRNAHLVPLDGEIYIETTHNIGSVVQVTYTDNVRASDICTAWAFGPQKTSGFCKMICGQDEWSGDHRTIGHTYEP